MFAYVFLEIQQPVSVTLFHFSYYSCFRHYAIYRNFAASVETTTVCNKQSDKSAIRQTSYTINGSISIAADGFDRNDAGRMQI